MYPGLIRVFEELLETVVLELQRVNLKFQVITWRAYNPWPVVQNYEQSHIRITAEAH